MANKFKILSVFGTRPEAIKMAVLVQKLAQDPAFETKICVTAQHRQMLDSVLDLFDIKPDFDLNLMRSEQDLAELSGQILLQLNGVFRQFRPDIVLVHGDTTTAFATSLACYYQQIPVAHIEAGLRTAELHSPFPEEAHRRLISVLADLHFAPTPQAQTHLLTEGKPPESVFVTGNTVIDTLFHVLQKMPQIDPLAPGKKRILVTAHRRENFGAGFERICHALKQIAQKYAEVDIIFPVHLNPQVQQPIQRLLGAVPNIQLLPPLNYVEFVAQMAQATLILTDSGGIQEEAAALGKPVLLMRNETERSENPCVHLVGTEICKILAETDRLLSSSIAYAPQNLYGNGTASEQIITVLKQWLAKRL